MRALLFGATGMVGRGVLLECLEDSRVTSVLAVVRSSTGVSHPKLRELTHEDYFDYSAIETELSGHDACFFCLGVSAAGKSEEAYRRLTYDLTLAAAETLHRLNPEMTFCYVSGAGTDSTEPYVREFDEHGWARVKGATENRLLGLGFGAAYMFRPGYIQPMKGARSKTSWIQAMYAVLGPLYGVWRTVAPGLVTDSETLGRAMLRVARDGFPVSVLETRDINSIAA